MTNPNAPFGFQILKSDGKENRVKWLAKTASQICYPGDVVELVAAGTVDGAAAAARPLGICAAYAAAADEKVAVHDDQSAEFFVQCSADFALADVGQNADFVATSGDTSLKRSKHAIDSATFGVSGGLPFKILGLYERGENAVGSYAIVKVKINNGMYASGTEGI